MKLGSLHVVIPLVLAGALSACAVGPDFHAPALAQEESYVEDGMARQTAAASQADVPAQNLGAGTQIIADWWTLFHSEPLNALVAAALRENAGLTAAEAALRQARETLRASAGSLEFPAVNGALAASRERASGAAFGVASPASEFNLYNAQVSVSYTFDLFGGVRRQLEALQAQVGYQENQLRAAQLALSANVVTAVVRAAQLQEQIQALREVEKLQASGLEIVERRFALGAVTRTDLLSQRTALAQTRAAIAPLERQRAQTRHLLAVYLGKAPSQIEAMPIALGNLALPLDLPLSVPSDLVHQRPDILAAEDLLHAASAQVGVATANLYPQLTLSANGGSTALSTQQLFTAGSTVWGLTGSLVQPIFHGGALLAQRRAAVAAFDQAAAAYRQTVLLAFENVADVLRALEFDAQALAAQTEAYAQARAAADIAQRQFDVGAGSYLSLLTAQQQFAQSAVAVVQARADRYADTAALFQALGGGWWNAAAPGAKPLASLP